MTTARSSRVLVLNNYALDAVWEEVRRGDKPAHHLFGVDRFAAAGYEVRFVPRETRRVLAGLNYLLARGGVPLGDLEHQVAALRLHEGDLLYCASGDRSGLLNLLRGLGWLRIPVVTVVHHPPNPGRLARWRAPVVRRLLRGADALPTLSRAVADAVNACARLPAGAPPKARALPWGPDGRFYGMPSADNPGVGVLAAGRTGRDFVTFGRGAARAGGAPATILCLAADVQPAFAEFTAGAVEVRTPPAGDAFTYPQMMAALRGARALAVPLFDDPSNLAGLTSVVDALALGKPLVVTRHPLLDLDVEALGIGRSIAPGDIDGWAEAIAWFHAHPEESLRMGRAARRLVDEGFNADAFARGILDLFARLAAGRPAFDP